MTKSTRPRRRLRTLQEPLSGKAGARTIASLGLRLVPIDPSQECQLAKVAASCESLQEECKRLFQHISNLLRDEDDLTRNDDSPPRATLG